MNFIEYTTYFKLASFLFKKINLEYYTEYKIIWKNPILNTEKITREIVGRSVDRTFMPDVNRLFGELFENVVMEYKNNGVVSDSNLLEKYCQRFSEDTNNLIERLKWPGFKTREGTYLDHGEIGKDNWVINGQFIANKMLRSKELNVEEILYGFVYRLYMANRYLIGIRPITKKPSRKFNDDLLTHAEAYFAHKFMVETEEAEHINGNQWKKKRGGRAATVVSEILNEKRNPKASEDELKNIIPTLAGYKAQELAIKELYILQNS